MEKENNVTATTTEEVAVTAKKTSKKAEAPKVRVKLPRLGGHNANQDEYFSVNFKSYLIKRGEYVEIPQELYEVIQNSEKAEDAAFEFIEAKKLRQPGAE